MKAASPVFWVFQKIKKKIPALVLLMASNVAGALLGVFFALGSKQVIDSAVAGSRELFLRACLVQLALIVGLIGTYALQRHLREWLAAELDRSFKKNLLQILLRGDYTEVTAFHSGELINRLNNDVRILNDGVLSAFPNFAALLTRLVAALVVLIGLEPFFGAGIIVLGAVMLAGTALLRRKMKQLHKRVSEADGKVTGFLQEALEKLLVVQALGAAEEMERRADKLLATRFEAQRVRKNVSLAANTGVSVFSYVVSFAALAWSAGGLLVGTMSFGELTAVTQLVTQLRMPMVNLSGIFPQYVAMVAAAERLMELEALRQPEEERLNATALYEQMEAIQAEGLSFSYNRDKVLSETDLYLPKGAFAVITGPSGIGKSTMLKLLLGVCKPDRGELFLQLDSGRQAIGRSTGGLFAYVPQGNLLFSGTIRENLLLANPDSTEDEIARAVSLSGMEEYVAQLPLGLETPLLENGAGLSEGQAQRLAIARAILSKAPILLLDEATSALDEDTEREVLLRLRSLKNCTCIAVTHRPAALQLADWQLEIENQKILSHKRNQEGASEQ
ncbi:MAG: ABC transporter ATP-binding protein [Oscillospiraceae bacterium]|nr:ABC transporter ATP-binding protein [Lachnospiraceae bacterium]MBP3684257.1 ABC transporter ATP-binding protein [Oscillospiraceae bacterium]